MLERRRIVEAVPVGVLVESEPFSETREVRFRMSGVDGVRLSVFSWDEELPGGELEERNSAD